MSWGSTLGVIALTTLAGAGAAALLANFLISWQQIPNREGASGYFAVALTGMGLIGGFLVGLAAALSVQSGFWKAQSYALAAVVALTLLAGVLYVVLKDTGPVIDGDKIVLEVELKCPRGWKPDNKAKSERGSFCWLQKYAVDGTLEANPMDSGGLDLDAAHEVDGQIVVPCAVLLKQARKDRFLRIFIGRKTDVTIRIPLPAKPGRQFKEWSPWTTRGFLPQQGNPAVTDYAFRCRVRGNTEFQRAHPNPSEVADEARKKAYAAMPADAPLVKWLPFFETERGSARPYSDGVYPEVEAVKAHATELGPLLQSSDRNVVRQAIFASATIGQIPPSVVEPLIEAGRGTVELLKEARAGALPGDPDLAAEERAYSYFFWWNHAAGKASGKRRQILEEIEREASAAVADGDSSDRIPLHLIVEGARKELEKLGVRQ